MFKNLTNEECSYLYGLFITDGFLTTRQRDNGKIDYSLGIELQEKDKDILEKIYQLLPEGHIYSRIRDTNFKTNYSCYSFYYLKQDFLLWLIEKGFPLKNKTENACPPNWEYDENAFWRGVIDGDGSIGLRYTRNILYPFISLTTKSEPLKLAYHEYLLKTINFNEKNHRNKRDNIYNITICNNRAMLLGENLYKNATIFLDRKHNEYLNCIEHQKNKIKEKENKNE